MNGRVYDPELGRFMSADPFVQAPYNSQSYNRYSYVFNNPLSFTDPSGYSCEGSNPHSRAYDENGKEIPSYSMGSGTTTLCGQDAYDYLRNLPSHMDQAWTISAPYFVDYETRSQLQFLSNYTGDNTFNFMDSVDQDSADELKKLQDKVDAKGYSTAATLLGGVLTVAEMKNKKKNADALSNDKATSQIDRKEFRKQREEYWKIEAQNNSGNYSAEDLARMQKGKPPIGSDGYPMELHHVDRTMDSELEAMTRTNHRLGENYKKNHPD